MNFREDAEIVGNALATIAPVFYGTFEEVKNEGVTEAEAFYIAISNVDLAYDNDGVQDADAKCTYSISAFVRSVQVDSEIRCLGLVSLAVSTLAATRIRSCPVLVESVARTEMETQSSCLYTMTAVTETTEVL